RDVTKVLELVRLSRRPPYAGTTPSLGGRGSGIADAERDRYRSVWAIPPLLALDEVAEALTGSRREIAALLPSNSVGLVINCGVDHPAVTNKSAIHALGVKGQAQHTGAIDRDDPARAPERAKFTDDGRRGAVKGLAGVAQAGGDLEPDAIADEKFPMAGRPNGAGRVVRTRPGAGDRRGAGPAGRPSPPSP